MYNFARKQGGGRSIYQATQETVCSSIVERSTLTMIAGGFREFRKDNYWMNGKEPQVSPWYVWSPEKIPGSRSKSEERTRSGCDYIFCYGKYRKGVTDYLQTSTLHGLRYVGERKLTWCESVKGKFQERTRSGCDYIFCYGKYRKGVTDYLKTSTLHGLRYVGERKLTWCERIFWLASFGFSVVIAAFFILNVYSKWQLSPMIVSVNPENMPLKKLPFPALTICNVNQAKKSVAERYIKDGDPVDKKLLESLCSSENDDAIFHEEEMAESADWDHTRSFLINVTQPCQEMIVRCVWNMETMPCYDLFNAHLTDEGLCCIFNVVHRDKMFRNPRQLNDLNLTFPSPAVDWTPETGYPADAPDNGFPWRPKGTGTHKGLTLVLDANIAEYYCASTKSPGFKILLHNPTETPKITNLGEIFAPGVEARVAIDPRIFDAQPNLRGIDVKKRNCVFSGEKTLMYFRTYTLKNCEMECAAQKMLTLCKCVLYYMPKNKTSRICGKADAKCYSNINEHKKDLSNACEECLPACSELSYTETMTTAPLSQQLVKSYAEHVNRTPEYFIENMLIAHFYFDDNSFIRYTKCEVFGLTEFLSNTGGLLGLCMGFSMMSMVELIYYMTLRVICGRRKDRPKHMFKL